LPGNVWDSNIKLTKYQKQIIETAQIFIPYKAIYTDYALEKLLENFCDVQSYGAEKKQNEIIIFQMAEIEKDGTKLRYKRDIQKVTLFFTFSNFIGQRALTSTLLRMSGAT